MFWKTQSLYLSWSIHSISSLFYKLNRFLKNWADAGASFCRCITCLFSNNFLQMTYYDFVFLIKAVFNKQATYNRQAEKVVTADTASESHWSSSCISWIRLYEFAILALDSNRCTMKPCLYSLSCRHILQRLKNILYFNIIFLGMISSNIEEARLIRLEGGKILFMS